MQREAEWIKQRTHQGMEHDAAKQRAAGLKELYRLAPALQHEVPREKFLQWAESKGVSREVILAETNPSTLAIAFKEFTKEVGANLVAAQRRHIAKTVPITRYNGEPGPQSSADAMKLFKETGSMDMLRLARELQRREQAMGL
jgi:hypothetical protein